MPRGFLTITIYISGPAEIICKGFFKFSIRPFFMCYIIKVWLVLKKQIPWSLIMAPKCLCSSLWLLCVTRPYLCHRGIQPFSSLSTFVCFNSHYIWNIKVLHAYIIRLNHSIKDAYLSLPMHGSQTDSIFQKHMWIMHRYGT